MAPERFAALGLDSLALSWIESFTDWAMHPVLGLGYAAGITLLFERDACKKRSRLWPP